MKAYLIVTGTIFALMAGVHIWRAVVEWPHNGPSAPFLLGMTFLVALPGALSWWGWSLLRNLSRVK